MLDAASWSSNDIRRLDMAWRLVEWRDTRERRQQAAAPRLLEPGSRTSGYRGSPGWSAVLPIFWTNASSTSE